MPHGPERLRPTQSADNEYLIYAALSGPAAGMQLAETRVEPISVPRPQPFDTVTIGVVTGRSLKLEFTVDEVKTREVVRDDLVLGFENGGKVVLKDYMHAFGLLGDQHTTIIQPDGKHYAFTELLAPTAGAKPEAPAAPGAAPKALIIPKPAPGQTERFKLSAEKPMALNFNMNDIARSEVNAEGDLVVTFKDRAVLVLEGYTALKGSADIALYFAKGDKISLADLAPGAGPEGDAAEGGHLFTQFAPGGSLGPLDHLGALGPEPFTLIPPPGPPASPPPLVPPNVPPPPDLPPPDLPPPPTADCKPPPPEDCEPPPRDCAPDVKDHATEGGRDQGEGGGKLTWIVAPGIDVAGDVEGAGGRWGERTDQASHWRVDAESAHRGWTEGHDGPALSAQHLQAAQLEPHAAWARDDAGAWHARDADYATPGEGEHDPGWHGDPGQGPGAPLGGAEHHGASMSPSDVFDSDGAAPAHAGDHGGAGFAAAAHDVGAVTAHAESHAPQVQNHAQHNVMGHG